MIWPISEARQKSFKKFWSPFGQWSFQKNCFWDLLTFSRKKFKSKAATTLSKDIWFIKEASLWKKSTLLSKYRKCNIFFAKSFLDCDGKTKSVDNYINHGLKWRKKRFNWSVQEIIFHRDLFSAISQILVSWIFFCWISSSCFENLSDKIIIPLLW